MVKQRHIMKNSHTIATIRSFIILVIVYLVGAFIQADFNIANWHFCLRVILSFIGLFASAVVYCITLDKY